MATLLGTCNTEINDVGLKINNDPDSNLASGDNLGYSQGERVYYLLSWNRPVLILRR
jgi:hypothetical protein